MAFIFITQRAFCVAVINAAKPRNFSKFWKIREKFQVFTLHTVSYHKNWYISLQHIVSHCLNAWPSEMGKLLPPFDEIF